MTYVEALRFLYSRGDWERSGAASDAARWDLRRMHALLAALGDPHLGRRTMHIAGSKGKGSTAAMIDAVLRQAGESTGLHSKPHLHRWTERIAVDGEPIAEEDFGRLMAGVAAQADALDASFGQVSTFEALVALTFLYFRERNVLTQVLEVGLGGRLDATNVFEQKDVCVITRIALEHTEILGDTIPQIAAEKAAIITPSTTVIMAPQRESAADVIRDVCKERGATLIEVAEACQMKRGGSSFDGQQFTLKTPQATYQIRLPLLGPHQLENAPAAVLALEALDIEMGEKTVRAGLADVRWPGRVEIIKRRPLMVADGAHNRESARALARTVREDLKQRDVTLVVGCSSDKDIDALADELAPIAAQVVATRSRHPRALDAREVANAFAARELPIAIEEPVGSAVDAAVAQSGGGTIVICGSLFVAAEAREHVLGIAYDPTPAPAAKNEVGV